MNDLTLDIEQRIEIARPIDSVFAALLRRLSTDNTIMTGDPMPMMLEAHPGGRWYRDLGNDAGHLWGHVQVIKPPTLLEITGPMFMSYPVASHMQFRLEESSGSTRITLRHRALGMIEDEHRQGVQSGWAHLLETIEPLIN